MIFALTRCGPHAHRWVLRCERAGVRNRRSRSPGQCRRNQFHWCQMCRWFGSEASPGFGKRAIPCKNLTHASGECEGLSPKVIPVHEMWARASKRNDVFGWNRPSHLAPVGMSTRISWQWTCLGDEFDSWLLKRTLDSFAARRRYQGLKPNENVRDGFSFAQTEHERATVSSVRRVSCCMFVWFGVVLLGRLSIVTGSSGTCESRRFGNCGAFALCALARLNIRKRASVTSVVSLVMD